MFPFCHHLRDARSYRRKNLLACRTGDGYCDDSPLSSADAKQVDEDKHLRNALASNPSTVTADEFSDANAGHLGMTRTATSDDFPGTAFSTVVLSRSWKYGGRVLWSDDRFSKAWRNSAMRSGLVRYSIAA